MKAHSNICPECNQEHGKESPYTSCSRIHPKPIYNFTPHEINEVIEEKSYPSNGNLRVSVVRKKTLNPILFVVKFGELEGLDKIGELPSGSIVIVSAMAKTALINYPNPKNFLFVSPGELVRDGSGKVIGCNGFDV